MPPQYKLRQWRCANCQFVNFGSGYDTCVQCQARFGSSSFLDDSSRGTAPSTLASTSLAITSSSSSNNKHQLPTSHASGSQTNSKKEQTSAKPVTAASLALESAFYGPFARIGKSQPHTVEPSSESVFYSSSPRESSSDSKKFLASTKPVTLHVSSSSSTSVSAVTKLSSREQEVSFYSSAPLPSNHANNSSSSNNSNNSNGSSGGTESSMSLFVTCSSAYPGDLSSFSFSAASEPKESAFYSSASTSSEQNFLKHPTRVSLTPWSCVGCSFTNSALRDTCLQCNAARQEPDNTYTNRRGSTASVASNGSEFSPAQGRMRETGSPPRVPMLPSQCECGAVFASPLVLKCEQCAKPRTPFSPHAGNDITMRRSSSSPRRSSLPDNSSKLTLPKNTRAERRTSLPDLSSASAIASSVASVVSATTTTTTLSEKDKKNLLKEEDRKKKEFEKEEERKKKESEKELERRRQVEKDKQKEDQRKLEKRKRKEEDREKEKLEKEKKEKEDFAPSKKFSEGYLRGLSVCGINKCTCLGFKPQKWSSKKCAECEHWGWKHDTCHPPTKTTRTLSGLSHNDVLRITWCEKESEQQETLTGDELFAAFESANQLVSLLTEVEDINDQNESELVRMSSESTTIGSDYRTLSRHASAASLDEAPLSISVQNQHTHVIPVGIPVQVPSSTPVVMGIPISVPMAVAIAAPTTGANVTMGIPVTNGEYQQQQHSYKVSNSMSSSSGKDEDGNNKRSSTLSNSTTSQDNHSIRDSTSEKGPLRLTASVDSLAPPSTPTRTSLSSSELHEHGTPERSPKTSLKSAISRLFAKKKDSFSMNNQDNSVHGTTSTKNETRNSMSETRLDNEVNNNDNTNNRNSNSSKTKDGPRTNITLEFVDAGSSTEASTGLSPTPSLSPGSSCMFSQFVSSPNASSSLAVPSWSAVSVRKPEETTLVEENEDVEDEGDDDYEGDISEDDEEDQGGLFSKTPMTPHVAASLRNLYLSTRSPAFPSKLVPKTPSSSPPDLSNVPVSMPPALAAHFRRSAGSAPNSPPPSSPNSPTSSPTKDYAPFSKDRSPA